MEHKVLLKNTFRYRVGVAASLLVLSVLLVKPVMADRLEQMISPISNFVNNEDPRIISEARFHYAYHEVQDQFATEGGDVSAFALQLRYAVDDRWAIIATKDGYIDFNPNATLAEDEGWADIEAGVKYAFYLDKMEGKIGTFALRYLFPVGDEEVLQGEGDGMIHPSFHGAWALNDHLNFMAGSGLRIPVDSDDSFFWDFDFHIDYQVPTDFGAIYPLFEVNMIHVVEGGKRLPIADEGQDLFNLGASEADGETILTGTAGMRYRPHDQVDLGFGYQFPFSSADGNRIIDYRWYFDIIFRL